MADDTRVSVREVYKLNEDMRKEVNLRFDAIEHKMEEQTQLYALRTEMHAETREREVLAKRISALEQWRWYALGAMAVLMGILIYFGNEIRSFLLGK